MYTCLRRVVFVCELRLNVMFLLVRMFDISRVSVGFRSERPHFRNVSDSSRSNLMKNVHC